MGDGSRLRSHVPVAASDGTGRRRLRSRLTPMTDWKSLLAAPTFRALWIALVLANLGSWAVLATLPILVAERFGDGGALVMSLGWRILPKILLAPVAGM